MMNTKKWIASAVLAATVSACAPTREASMTIRNGIEVNNIQAGTCLDVGPAQVCAFRFEIWDEPVFVFSTDTDYRAWMGGEPIDF